MPVAQPAIKPDGTAGGQQIPCRLQFSAYWSGQAQGDNPNPLRDELAAPDEGAQLQGATGLNAAAAAADPSYWCLLTAHVLTHFIIAIAAV